MGGHTPGPWTAYTSRVGVTQAQGWQQHCRRGQSGAVSSDGSTRLPLLGLCVSWSREAVGQGAENVGLEPALPVEPLRLWSSLPDLNHQECGNQGGAGVKIK